MKITATSITQDYLRHTGTIQVSQSDYQDYMDNGPGRFAVGAQFELVTKFFDHLPSSLAPGSYTKQELANFFELDSYGFIMQQYSYQDNIDDYGERIYIWNSQSYKITDNALFILEANGEKRIENFGIEYWVSKNEDGELLYENFDFESGDLAAIAGNGMDLQKCIDPHNRGQTVDIIFDGQVRTRTYTATDLSDDRRKMKTWSGLAPLKARRDVIGVRDKVIREASIPHCLNNKKRGFNLRASSGSSIGTMMQCLSDNFHTKSDSIGDPHFGTMDKYRPLETHGLRFDGQRPGEVVVIKDTGVNATYEVHARHELWDHPLLGSNQVSVNTAITMRVDGNTVVTLKLPSRTTQTPTQTQTMTPTPIPSQQRDERQILPRDTTNPFDITGLTVLEGTSSNDNLVAQQNVPTLFWGKEDNGTAILSPTTGNITMIFADSFRGANPFGYYVVNATGFPSYGQVIWADPSSVLPGASFLLPSNVLPQQVGYFLIPSGYSQINLQAGLSNGVNVTFGQVNGEWGAFINGTALNRFSTPTTVQRRALFSNTTLNPIYYNQGAPTRCVTQYTYGTVQQWVNDCIADFYSTNVFSFDRKWVSSFNLGDKLTASLYVKSAYRYDLNKDGVDGIENLSGGAPMKIIFEGGTANDIELLPISISEYYNANRNATKYKIFIRTKDNQGKVQGILLPVSDVNQTLSYITFNTTVGTTLPPSTLTPTTLQPTTQLPSTLAPTTQSPTTLVPTTLSPTPEPTYPPALCEDMLYINGECFGMNPGEVKVVGNGLMYRDTVNSNRYTVVDPSGNGMVVVFRGPFIDLQTFLSSARESGTVEGLMVSDNGRLVFPNNTLLPPQITASLLHDYMFSWCVGNPQYNRTRLFFDDPGQNITTCNDPRYTPQYTTLSDYPENEVEQARQRAIEWGFNATSPDFDDVVLDIVNGLDYSGGPSFNTSDIGETQKINVVNQVPTLPLPTTQPTTNIPSTIQPSTLNPTTTSLTPSNTIRPSTRQPSTILPSTKQPSTLSPTSTNTIRPSTKQPNTIPSSTKQPAFTPTHTVRPSNTSTPSLGDGGGGGGGNGNTPSPTSRPWNWGLVAGVGSPITILVLVLLIGGILLCCRYASRNSIAQNDNIIPNRRRDGGNDRHSRSSEEKPRKVVHRRKKSEEAIEMDKMDKEFKTNKVQLQNVGKDTLPKKKNTDVVIDIDDSSSDTSKEPEKTPVPKKKISVKTKTKDTIQDEFQNTAIELEEIHTNTPPNKKHDPMLLKMGNTLIRDVVEAFLLGEDNTAKLLCLEYRKPQKIIMEKLGLGENAQKVAKTEKYFDKLLKIVFDMVKETQESHETNNDKKLIKTITNALANAAESCVEQKKYHQK